MTIPYRWALGLVAAGLALLACWWIVASLSSGKRAQVEARVEAGRGEAMGRSGADAVDTLGDRHAAETKTDKGVSNAQDAIDNADDLGGADGAARDGLCDVAADYC